MTTAATVKEMVELVGDPIEVKLQHPSSSSKCCRCTKLRVFAAVLMAVSLVVMSTLLIKILFFSGTSGSSKKARIPAQATLPASIQATRVWQVYKAKANTLPASYFTDITDAKFLWRITKNGALQGEFLLDYSMWPLTVESGYPTIQPPPEADVTITLDDDTFMGLRKGTVSGFWAVLDGRVKVDGNVMLLYKLDSLMKIE